MSDLELAIKTLQEKELTLAIVKDGQVLFESKDKGIKPMYTAVRELKEELKGGSVADKVIGRAAAILCKHVGIKEIYTYLISEEAISILKDSGIKFSYDKSSPFIKNRDKTDMCPVEKLSQKVQDPEELLKDIEKFLENIRKMTMNP